MRYSTSPVSIHQPTSQFPAILSFLAVTPVALAASLGVCQLRSLFSIHQDTLYKKACTLSECIRINGRGQFCGNEAVNPACTNGHVFECNKDTGKTCDY